VSSADPSCETAERIADLIVATLASAVEGTASQCFGGAETVLQAV